MAVRPHVTIQLSLHGFLRNLVFEYFSKFCRKKKINNSALTARIFTKFSV